MSRTRDLLAAVVLSLLTAACGPLPRPFASDPSGPVNQLVIPPERPSVVVGRVPDLDPVAANALAEALAEALQSAEVVATTRGLNIATFSIDGHVESADGKRRIVFDLLTPRGAVAASHAVDIPGGADEIARDEERSWVSVANSAARYLAPAVLGDAPPPAPTSLAAVAPAAGPTAPAATGTTEARAQKPPSPPTKAAAPAPAAPPKSQPAAAPPPATAVTIAILPIEGVANENARLLASALNFHLQQFGVKTAPPSGKAQQVRGTVKITEKPGSQQRKLAFVWTVLAPDGKEIGKVEQANDVSAQLLQTAWPDIAFAVAGGAADGIVNVLEERGIIR